MTPLKPLSQTLSKTLRFLNKNSSTILSIGAGVCTVGAVVSAADATSKTLTAIQEQRTQELLKIVDRTRDQGREPDIRKIVELTNNDDYKLTVKDAVRTWALPVTLTTASLACIFFNHQINAKKQAALIAATASAASMLNVYRNTVTDKLGTDADNKVVDIVIVCTFNNYNVVAVRHKVPALTFDTYKEKNLEEVRYMFLVMEIIIN